MPADPSFKYYLTKRKPKRGSKPHPTGIYYIGYHLERKRK
jgi:hypothetical protein